MFFMYPNWKVSHYGEHNQAHDVMTLFHVVDYSIFLIVFNAK
jgi:hypothetical protein